MVDQYKSTKEEFIQDIVEHYDEFTTSDLQGYIGARCMTTGEDEEDFLTEVYKRV